MIRNCISLVPTNEAYLSYFMVWKSYNLFCVRDIFRGCVIYSSWFFPLWFKQGMGKLLPQIWVKFGTIDIDLHKFQPVAVWQRKMTNKTNHILFVSGMSIVFNQTSNINYTGFVKDIWEFNQIAPCPEYLGQYVTGNNGFGFHLSFQSFVPWFWFWCDRTYIQKKF